MSWKTSCHSLKHYLKVLFSVFKEKGFKMKFCRFIALIVTIFALSACDVPRFQIQQNMFNYPDYYIGEKVKEFEYGDEENLEIVFKNFMKIDENASFISGDFSQLGFSVQFNNIPEDYEIIINELGLRAEVIYDMNGGPTIVETIDVANLEDYDNPEMLITQEGVPYNFFVDKASEITKYLKKDSVNGKGKILGVNLIVTGDIEIDDPETLGVHGYSGDYYTIYLDNKEW